MHHEYEQTSTLSNLSTSTSPQSCPESMPCIEYSAAANLPTTMDILQSYGLPKTTEYYTSKGSTCILDQYKNEIIQCFDNNKIMIRSFYDLSLNRSSFVSMISNAISAKSGESTTELHTAIKKLYTILHMHQHMAGVKDSVSTLDSSSHNDIYVANTAMTRALKGEDANPNALELKRQRTRRRMDCIVNELSQSKSELLTLQQNNDILKVIADETQRKLIEYEQRYSEYQKKMTALRLDNERLKTSVHEFERKYDAMTQTKIESVSALTCGSVDDSTVDETIASGKSRASDDVKQEWNDELNSHEPFAVLDESDMRRLSKFYQEMNNSGRTSQEKFKAKTEKMETKLLKKCENKGFWASIFGFDIEKCSSL